MGDGREKKRGAGGAEGKRERSLLKNRTVFSEKEINQRDRIYSNDYLFIDLIFEIFSEK